MADLADLIRQSSYLGAGGKPEGGRDIDKVNNIFGTLKTSNDYITEQVKNVLARKKAQLENQGLEQEQKPLGEAMGQENISQVPTLSPYANLPTKQFQSVASGEAMLGAYGQRQAQTQQLNKQMGENVYVSKDGKQIFTDKTQIPVGQEANFLEFGKKEATSPIVGGLMKQQSNGLSPEALDDQARLYMKTGALPSLGMQAGARTQILNRASELFKGQGDFANAVAANKMAMVAGQQELSNIQKNRGVVGAFTNTLDRQLGLLQQYSSKVNSTGIPALQRWINAGKVNILGDTDVNNLDTVINTVNSEYARAMNTITGGGAIADAAITRNQDRLSNAKTPDQIQGWIDTIQQETSNRAQGYSDQINGLKGSLFDSGSFKESVPNNLTVPPTPPAVPKTQVQPVSEHNEAMKWALEHPLDPRAQEIKRINGR